MEEWFGKQPIPVLLTLAGTILVTSEALMPGAYLIVLGGALFCAGVTGLLVPFLSGAFGLSVLVLGYGLLSFVLYREFSVLSGPSEKTKSSDSLMGEVGVVSKRVDRNTGQVKLDIGFNPHYQARSLKGGEIPEGTEVIVVDPGGGNVLKVKPVEQLQSVRNADEIDESNRQEVLNELRAERESSS